MPFNATRAAGAAKGYGFTAAAAESPNLVGYYGTQYSGITAPIVFSSAPDSTYISNDSDVQQGLQFFIDRAAQKIYAAYGTACQYTMLSAPSANYDNNASFYRITGTKTDLSGHSDSGIASSGRGCTVAYLTGGARTPVLCMGHSSNKNIYFFRVSDGGFLGKMSVASFSGFTGTDIRTVVWDGQYLVVTNATDSTAFRTLLPSTITDGGSLTLFDSFSLPNPVSYGGAWTGNSYIFSSVTVNSAASELVKSGSSYTLVGALNKFDLGTSNYSIAIDYKNKVLVMGGYSNATYRTFVGV